MTITFRIISVLIWITAYSIQCTDYSITQTGIYVLGDNLASTPLGAGNIVNITSSDVVLDLNNEVIFQTNAVASVDAIVVNAGLTNVTIKNGTIRQVTGQGIVINSSCSNIRLQNVTLENCGLRGINFAGAAAPNQIIDSFIDGCTVRNCANGAAGDFGLWLQQVSKTKITNCVFDGIGSGSTVAGTVVVAIEADNCASLNFDTIQIAGCISPVVTGVRLNPASNCAFTNCLFMQSSGNTATGVFGFRLSGASVANVFQNCTVLNNTNVSVGFNPDNSTAANNLFLGCNVLGNTGTTLPFIGFSLQATGMLLDCNSAANSTTSGTCFGYQLNAANNGLLLRCVGNNNTSTATVAVGLNIIGASATWVINLCQFSNNLGNVAANSFGVRIVSGVTNLFTQNVAFNNRTTAANQLNGVPAGSQTAANSTTLATPTVPWTNMQIIP